MAKLGRKKRKKRAAKRVPVAKKVTRKVRYRFPGINRSRSRAVYCLETRLALTKRMLNVALKRAGSASKVDRVGRKLSLPNRRKLLEYAHMLQKLQ